LDLSLIFPPNQIKARQVPAEKTNAEAYQLLGHLYQAQAGTEVRQTVSLGYP
jgi:hypothetical protein